MLGHKFVRNDVPCNIYFLYVHGAAIIYNYYDILTTPLVLEIAITAPAGGEILVTCINQFKVPEHNKLSSDLSFHRSLCC